MVAGGMTFYFAQANVLHNQYLAADLSIRSYSPAAVVKPTMPHMDSAPILS